MGIICRVLPPDFSFSVFHLRLDAHVVVAKQRNLTRQILSDFNPYRIVCIIIYKSDWELACFLVFRLFIHGVFESWQHPEKSRYYSQQQITSPRKTRFVIDVLSFFYKTSVQQFFLDKKLFLPLHILVFCKYIYK